MQFIFLSLPEDIFSLLLERKERIEEEGSGKHQLGASPTCPDWGSNPQPFSYSYGTTFQPPEPCRLGLNECSLKQIIKGLN